MGYWNFRLEFVMPYTSQHTRDVPNLSAYEYDCEQRKRVKEMVKIIKIALDDQLELDHS